MTYANMRDVRDLLFKSDISTYRISKDTGIGEPTINNYRKGRAKLENMTFANAAKLQKYYDKIKGDGNLMSKRTREENFGRAYAYLNSVGLRRFEEGKMTVEGKYVSEGYIEPMTKYTRAYKDVMQYAKQFDDVDKKLLDQVHKFIDDLGTEGFNDDQLQESFIVYFSKQMVEIRKEYNL